MGSKNVGSISLTEVRDKGVSQPFTLRADPGRLLVLYFGYTNCPDLCPTTLSDLRAARERLGRQASRTSVAFATVDSVNDTPQVLLAYVKQFGFGQGDHALRPQTDAELAKAESALFASSSATKNADGSTAVGHTAWSYVINDKGALIDAWPYGTTSKAMSHDLSLLLKKAA